MKKLSLFLAVVLLFAICACDGTPPEPQGFDYGAFPLYGGCGFAPVQLHGGERVRPFWLGNVMYNETAMFVEEGDTAVARTMFEPEKIIAVPGLDAHQAVRGGKGLYGRGGRHARPHGGERDSRISRFLGVRHRYAVRLYGSGRQQRHGEQLPAVRLLDSAGIP